MPRAEDTAPFRCLAATPGYLRSLVELAPPEKRTWRPSPDRWSIAQILRHLTDVEKLNLGLRVRKMLEESAPTFEDYDPAKRDAEGAYPNEDATEALTAFETVRRESLEMLRGTSTADWLRTGQHPAVGEVRVSQLLNLWAFHDLSHTRQIAEIVKATTFWDGIGSLQVYYRVDP